MSTALVGLYRRGVEEAGTVKWKRRAMIWKLLMEAEEQEEQLLIEYANLISRLISPTPTLTRLGLRWGSCLTMVTSNLSRPISICDWFLSS